MFNNVYYNLDAFIFLSLKHLLRFVLNDIHISNIFLFLLNEQTSLSDTQWNTIQHE